MKRILVEPILRQELAIALSNAVVGLLLALVLGITASLWWVGLLAAVATFAFAAVSDRRDIGLLPSAVLVGLFVLVFAGLWLAGQSVLGAVPLAILGTSLGFGCNRIVFGVVLDVPERRRERQQRA